MGAGDSGERVEEGGEDDQQEDDQFHHVGRLLFFGRGGTPPSGSGSREIRCAGAADRCIEAGMRRFTATA